MTGDFDIVAFLPALRKYALALTHSADAAQDLLQETCVRALDKQHLYRPDTNLRAWLFTIMHNLFISGRRRARFAPVVDLDAMAELVSSAPTPFEALSFKELSAIVGQLPKDRLWLVEKAIDGYEYEHLATAIGQPVGTVKSRISRGFAQVRRLI